MADRRRVDKWLTVDEYGMKNRTIAKLRDAVFMGELDRGLESLGVELDYGDLDRSKNGEVRWEVAGTDEELRRYWSTNNERAWKIRREYEEEHGRPISEVTLSAMLYGTRRAKSRVAKEFDTHPNWELWRQDARRAGFRLSEVDVSRPTRHENTRNVDELRRRLLGPNGLVAQDAVFDETSIRPTIARVGVGLGFSQGELAEHAKHLLIDSKELVCVRKARDPEHRLWTTKTMMRAETYVQGHRDSHRHQWVDITGRAGESPDIIPMDNELAVELMVRGEGFVVVEEERLREPWQQRDAFGTELPDIGGEGIGS